MTNHHAGKGSSGWTRQSAKHLTACHLKKKQLFPLSPWDSQARWSGSSVDGISHRCIQAPRCTKSGIKLISRPRFNGGLCNKANIHCSQDPSSALGICQLICLSQSAGGVVHLHHKSPPLQLAELLVWTAALRRRQTLFFLFVFCCIAQVCPDCCTLWKVWLSSVRSLAPSSNISHSADGVLMKLGEMIHLTAEQGDIFATDRPWEGLHHSWWWWWWWREGNCCLGSAVFFMQAFVNKQVAKFSASP